MKPGSLTLTLPVSGDPGVQSRESNLDAKTPLVLERVSLSCVYLFASLSLSKSKPKWKEKGLETNKINMHSLSAERLTGQTEST